MKSIYTSCVLLTSLLLLVYPHQAQSQKKNETMNTNKETVRRLYEECMNKRNYELLKDCISDDFIAANGQKGASGFEQNIKVLVQAFPDIQWKIEDLLQEGEQAAVHHTWKGTSTAAFNGIAPVNKVVTDNGLVLFKFKNNKIISATVSTDRLGFLVQMGVIPASMVPGPAQGAANGNATTNAKNKENTRLVFIDRFVVPEKAWPDFIERCNYNRGFIKKQPGFIKDAAYEAKDDKGNILFVTTAIWENDEALKKAKETVQADYKRIGFDPGAFMKQLNITMERAIYKENGL